MPTQLDLPQTTLTSLVRRRLRAEPASWQHYAAAAAYLLTVTAVSA